VQPYRDDLYGRMVREASLKNILGGDAGAFYSTPPPKAPEAPSMGGHPTGSGREKLVVAANDWMQGNEATTMSLGVPIFDYKKRGDIKHNIVTELANRTGIDYDICNEFIRQWAVTSNDNDYRSLSIQERAAEVFGVELSDWQVERLNDVLAWRETEIERLNDSGKPLIGGVIRITETRRGEMRQGVPYSSHDEAIDSLLTAMRNMTQEELKAAGIERVVIYRGVKFDSDPQEMELISGTQGQNVGYTGNAIESWTTQEGTGERFAGSHGGGYVGAVYRMEIPVERVVGTARTGFGCLDEWEWVIIGGEGDVVETLTIFDKR